MATAVRRPARSGDPLPARYKVGQRVLYSLHSFNPRTSATARFFVVRVLPGDGGRPTYRIKSEDEAYERSAEERQLSAPSFED
jgi:hypothetical protein